MLVIDVVTRRARLYAVRNTADTLIYSTGAKIVIIIHYRSVSADILQNKHKKCCRIVVFSK